MGVLEMLAFEFCGLRGVGHAEGGEIVVVGGGNS